jgi:alkylation response protein AidB-like acyl-CoA dehydrogenase
MNFDESDTVTALRQSLERFVEREMPRNAAAKWDKDNHFPRDVHRKLADLGVLGLTIPEEFGGYGRDIVATMVTIEELSRRSLAVSVPYIMAACYAGMNIEECGTEAQKGDLLPKIVAGDMLFAYGLTEPDAGADLASVKTRAERDGDVIRINGAKRFCSGADIADYI